MCGRFLINEEMLEAVSRFVPVPHAIQGEFDLGVIFPSNPSLIIYEEKGQRAAGVREFGYLSEKLKKRIINARAETAGEKWMFKRALHDGRCLIPCALFYEWDADKQKISFTEKGHPVMYMAGLEIQDSFIILTTAANASMAPFHHRMPLILSEEEGIAWLESEKAGQELLKIVPPSLSHHVYEKQPKLF